jgi:glycosyltransferase involved in cell wall biosynthesis
MLAQTMSPEEIVVAVDGSISDELDFIIREYETTHTDLFSVYRYEVNAGLGKLLNKTLPLCRNEHIARMDADDYSEPDRVEEQLEILASMPDIDVVGSNVDEFNGDIKNTVACVVLPEKQNDIFKFAKRRCPIRHPALLYKKSDVLRVGNYNAQDYVQDYELAVRLLQAGLKFYNIQRPLVRMRVSKNFYARRGGLRYLRCIYTTKKKFLSSGFISFAEFLISFGGQAVVILMPGWLRSFIYKTFLRG